MKNKKLVIPIDFTDATNKALEYAVQFSTGSPNDLILLHIAEDIKEDIAKIKLQQFADKALANYSGAFEVKILEGKVTEQIGNFADSIDADYIIMGIHENSRLEKLFGSKAIDVISRSKVPFIIVQNGTAFQAIRKIAMTIDLETESIQVVKSAADLAQELGAELVLVAGDHHDADLRQKITNNMRVALDFLEKHEVKSSIRLLERKNFFDDFITYCQQEQIDLIAVTYYINTFQLLSTKFVQHLLANDLKIPVLTIEAKALASGPQFSFITT